MQPDFWKTVSFDRCSGGEDAQRTTNIIVDVHGETTSEKNRARRFLDGKVSASLELIPTFRPPTSGFFQVAGFLCDAGMCGPVNSILGRAVDPIMNRFISNLPASFPVAGGEVRLVSAYRNRREHGSRRRNYTRQ